MLATLLTVAQSFVLAIVAGFALGVLLYRLPRLRRALDPLLASYYACRPSSSIRCSSCCSG